jgi:outer membrane protein TolC
LKGSFIRQRQAFYNVALPRRETHLVHYYQTITTPEASLSYTIYDFGQRKFSSEIARQSLFYADLSHNQEIQTVLQVVMKDYYDYQLQKQQLIALKADLNDADVSLDAAVEQFQNGTASVGDVIQAKTKFLQTKMELISQTKRVENSFASLASNVGLPANIRFKVQDFPNEVFPSDHLENVSSLIAKAQEKRQDLFAAQANVKANEANVSYAKRHGLPVIDTELDLGKNFYDKGLTEDYHFSVLIKLNYPLFKGFYYKNEKRNALAKLQKAKALLEQMELSVIKDVTTSHFNVKSSAETVQCAKDYLSAAEERFDIAISNYKAGTAPILDVISAQSSLADARAKNAKAKKDWFVSLADLAYATGSLCINEESKCQ